MNFRIISSIEFSNLPNSERLILRELNKTLLAKLKDCQTLFASLKSQIRQTVYLLNQVRSNNNQPLNNHPLWLRLSVLKTTLYALRRDWLNLYRDLLILRRYIGYQVTPRMWQAWTHNRDHIEREVPNVHDHFLRSAYVQEDYSTRH